MVKSSSSSLQRRSAALQNRSFNNARQIAPAGGSFPKEVTSSNNVSEPSENEYSLCQRSPSSDISFGWQEVSSHLRTASRCSSYDSDGVRALNTFTSECTNSDEQINVTTQDSSFSESVEGKEASNYGVTATSNEGDFRKDKERVAQPAQLSLMNVLSENLGGTNFRKNETRRVENVNMIHSEELADPQKLTGIVAEDSCKKKKIRDVPIMKDSGSDSLDDSVEMSSLLKDEEYGLVQMGSGLDIENLTEEEEIWMVQCPISLKPQDLINEELVFGGTSEFALQIQDLDKYETTSYVGRNKPVSYLLPHRGKGSLKARVLQPEGLIVIMEKVDVPEVKLTPSKQSNFQAPQGLRVRHPLFGYDYKDELEVRKEFMSQQRRMLHEDLLIQPKRIKKEKKKKARDVKSSTTSVDAEICNDREKWQTHDEWEQECHNNKHKTKKSKNNYDKEHKKKKEKHKKNH